MCCESFWERIIPFGLALTCGLAITNILQKQVPVNKNQENIKPVSKVIYSNSYSNDENLDKGRGCGECGGKNVFNDEEKTLQDSKVEVKAIQILAKPKAIYTDLARQNQVQGIVTLRVTFLANRTIGNISPVSGLPDGLTEQAVTAAREIKFVPQQKNGVPQTVAKLVQYTFTLY